LNEFLDRKNFKTYEELSRKLASVLNSDTTSIPTAASLSEEDEDEYVPPVREVKKPAVKIVASNANSDEEAMSYFKKIAMEE
jgi:hypothetical protein